MRFWLYVTFLFLSKEHIYTFSLVKISFLLFILLYIGTLLYYNHFYRKDMPTAFSPPGGLSCPRKIKKRLRIYWIWWEYLAVHPKAKFWHFSVKNRKKSAGKHSIEKPILLNFVKLSPIFCPRLWIDYCSTSQHMHGLSNSVVTQSIVKQLLFWASYFFRA